MIDTVFFDAAGTLIRTRGSVGGIYRRTAVGFGFEPSREDRLQERIEEAFQAALRQKEPLIFPGSSRASVEPLEREWWRDVVYRTFARLGDFQRIDECFEELYDLFRTPRGWELEPGCQEVLAELRRRGLKLGIISNFDSRLSGLLASLDIGRYFSDVTVCSLASAAKPQPEIFYQALEKIESEAENSLHLGDDFEQDFQGARAAGLQALLYDPRNRFTEVEPEHRIRTLAGLLSFLV